MPRKSDALRSDVKRALKAAFPDGLIEMPFYDEEESYLDSTYPALAQKLSRIPGGRIAFEREPFPEPEWAEGDDPDEDPPAFTDFDSSYRLLFLECLGDEMTYEVESETYTCDIEVDYGDELAHEEIEVSAKDEVPELITVMGTGVAGCSVGLSLIAPFAVVDFNVMDRYEDGSRTVPDLFPSAFILGADEPFGFSDHLSDLLGAKAWRRLEAFRNRAVKILDSHAIRVLEEDQLLKRVHFLRFSEDVSPPDVEPTVRSALFFREL